MKLRQIKRKKKAKSVLTDALTFSIATVGILMIWSGAQEIEDGMYILPGLLQMLLGFAILGLLQAVIKIAREIRNEERGEDHAWNHRSTSSDGPKRLHSRTEL